MAKRDGKPKASDEAADSEQYCAFFEAQQDAAVRTMGRHNVLVGTEEQQRKYGVEIPSIALQYVVQSDVLFMEQLLMLAGKPASHKSSFAFELARWVIWQAGGGYGRVFDTERKYSPTLAMNLIGDLDCTPLGDHSWGRYVCDTYDQWAKAFTKSIKNYRNHFAIGRKQSAGTRRRKNASSKKQAPREDRRIRRGSTDRTHRLAWDAATLMSGNCIERQAIRQAYVAPGGLSTMLAQAHQFASTYPRLTPVIREGELIVGGYIQSDEPPGWGCAPDGTKD